MNRRTKVLARFAALAVATVTYPVGAAPVLAAQPVPLTAAIEGTLEITGMGPSGPTSASYGGEGVATHLGVTRMEGKISITGPAGCANGFIATHTDTLTASNGDQLVVAITETSCPRESDPSTYDCTGDYTVTGGTGRFASTTGSGTWSGSVAFSPEGTATFKTTYSGVISGP